MANGYPDGLNPIINRILENSAEFNAKDKDKQSDDRENIAKGMMDAMAQLNALGQERVIKELFKRANNGQLEVYDASGNVEIGIVTKVTSSIVEQKIREAELEDENILVAGKSNNEIDISNGKSINDIIQTFDGLSFEEKIQVIDRFEELSDEEKLALDKKVSETYHQVTTGMNDGIKGDIAVELDCLQMIVEIRAVVSRYRELQNNLNRTQDQEIEFQKLDGRLRKYPKPVLDSIWKDGDKALVIAAEVIKNQEKLPYDKRNFEDLKNGLKDAIVAVAATGGINNIRQQGFDDAQFAFRDIHKDITDKRYLKEKTVASDVAFNKDSKAFIKGKLEEVVTALKAMRYTKEEISTALSLYARYITDEIDQSTIEAIRDQKTIDISTSIAEELKEKHGEDEYISKIFDSLAGITFDDKLIEILVDDENRAFLVEYMEALSKNEVEIPTSVFMGREVVDAVVHSGRERTKRNDRFGFQGQLKSDEVRLISNKEMVNAFEERGEELWVAKLQQRQMPYEEGKKVKVDEKNGDLHAETLTVNDEPKSEQNQNEDMTKKESMALKPKTKFDEIKEAVFNFGKNVAKKAKGFIEKITSSFGGGNSDSTANSSSTSSSAGPSVEDKKVQTISSGLESLQNFTFTKPEITVNENSNGEKAVSERDDDER